MALRLVVTALALVSVTAACAPGDPASATDHTRPDRTPAQVSASTRTPAQVPASTSAPAADETSTTALPDLVGAPIAAARAEVTAAGLTPRVVVLDDAAAEFDDEAPVTGHHPAAGDRVAGEVTLWVGTPPEANPPGADDASDGPSEPATGAPGEPDATGAQGDPDATGAAGEGTPAADDEATPRADASPGREDGSDHDAPTGPRTNIRTVAREPAGTALSGPASWYGPGFAGRATACGGVFDPEELTLATRELRCGTLIEVEGPHGSVEATVTDWGPAEWTGRRFDLSRATFAEVAPLGAGVVEVTLTVIDY